MQESETLSGQGEQAREDAAKREEEMDKGHLEVGLRRTEEAA